MRCKACDRILEEKEMLKKDNHGEFLDLCNYCLFSSIDINVDSFGTITEDLFLTNDDDSDTLY
jgi:hypothetical protein|tara:strand:- start:1220 stop:1408 length:189 start_codon:yes stop_codon:yes gene_type:complete